MDNEDSLWSTAKILGVTLSGWMHSIMMKQVVDGTHASRQVEQYENNLNECLWLSNFFGGMASGECAYAA